MFKFEKIRDSICKSNSKKVRDFKNKIIIIKSIKCWIINSIKIRLRIQ